MPLIFFLKFKNSGWNEPIDYNGAGCSIFFHLIGSRGYRHPKEKPLQDIKIKPMSHIVGFSKSMQKS